MEISLKLRCVRKRRQYVRSHFFRHCLFQDSIFRGNEFQFRVYRSHSMIKILQSSEEARTFVIWSGLTPAKAPVLGLKPYQKQQFRQALRIRLFHAVNLSPSKTDKVKSRRCKVDYRDRRNPSNRADTPYPSLGASFDYGSSLTPLSPLS